MPWIPSPQPLSCGAAGPRGGLGHDGRPWAPHPLLGSCRMCCRGGRRLTSPGRRGARQLWACGPPGSLSPAGHPRRVLSARQPRDSACVLLKLMELVKTEVPLFIFPLLNKNALNIYSLLSQFLLTSASGFTFLAVGRRGEGSGLLADFRLWRTSA